MIKQLIYQIPAILLIAATFGMWGLLLAVKLTRPGMIFGWLPKLVPDNLLISKPLWSCATCVAGFQSLVTCSMLATFSDLYPVCMVPAVIIAMGTAFYLDLSL